MSALMNYSLHFGWLVEKWGHVVNKSKTNVIHLWRAGQDVTNFYFTFWNEPVGVIQTYRYLGLVLNEFWDISTVEVWTVVAGRAYGSMRNKHYQIDGFNYEKYLTFFISLVIPVITYGFSIWGK